jgi:hypothetical protein
MELYVAADGSAQCLYGDEISLAGIGALTIRRASHVDPDDHGQWWADLSPSAGPKLGPFVTRSAALAAECDWLTAHIFNPQSVS